MAIEEYITSVETNIIDKNVNADMLSGLPDASKPLEQVSNGDDVLDSLRKIMTSNLVRESMHHLPNRKMAYSVLKIINSSILTCFLNNQKI